MAVSGYFPLALFHGEVVRAAFGPRFEEAGSPLLFLIPGAVAFAAVAAVRVLPAAAGQASPHLASTAVALGAQLAAIAILAPAHGANGAAWGRATYDVVLAFVITPFAIATLLRQSPHTGEHTE